MLKLQNGICNSWIKIYFPVWRWHTNCEVRSSEMVNICWWLNYFILSPSYNLWLIGLYNITLYLENTVETTHITVHGQLSLAVGQIRMNGNSLWSTRSTVRLRDFISWCALSYRQNNCQNSAIPCFLTPHKTNGRGYIDYPGLGSNNVKYWVNSISW